MRQIYLFEITVPAITKREGHAIAMAMIEKCHKFADTYGFIVSADLGDVVNKRLSIRAMFQISDDEKPVLLEVAALFTFAAKFKFELINMARTSKEV